MFDNPFSMVVAIVFIVMTSVVLITRYRSAARSERIARSSAEDKALREEMQALKERVQVLERIATDAHDALRIDQEIARLRDR
jgi:hypothetical protein